jgi:serine/threonine protein kinase
VTLETEHVFNGRYRVDTKLGTGGTAIVYCGTDLLLRRRVAIKVLRDQYSSDDDFIRRFSYEAQAAAKLSHPNVVNVFDFGREGDAYFIVMERRCCATSTASPSRLRSTTRRRSRPVSPSRIAKGCCIATSSPRTSW